MQLNPAIFVLSAILAGTGDMISRVDLSGEMKGSCILITRQEAAAAVGAAVPAGTEKLGDIPLKGGGSIKAQYCLFGSEALVARFALGPTAAALFNDYRKSMASEKDYLNVTGVGDEAFRAKGQLAIRKGQSGLIIDVGQRRGYGGAAELKKEKALAAIAVGRM